MVTKRKRPNTPIAEGDSATTSTVSSEVPSPLSTVVTDQDDPEAKRLVFKDPAFLRTSRQNNKKKGWRSLKQILTQERSLPWPGECVLYSCINAPPSFKPTKKYSDISGLLAKYTDPQTKLFYATAGEFSTVRRLPSDIVVGYLSLRRANTTIN